MSSHKFQHVNVFSSQLYTGNPVAVIAQADNLSTTEMQQIARWCNLSETVFLLEPTQENADYKVRIFTANAQELPFAGHPTLGACHAWLQNGGRFHEDGLLIQECGVGLITLSSSEQGRLSFAAPPMTHQALPAGQLDELCTILNLDPHQVKASRVLDNGRSYTVLLLDSANSVLSLFPDMDALKKTQLNVGLIGPYPQALETDENASVSPNFEVRYFTPLYDRQEDPITGNLNGAIAQWLIETQQAPTAYLAAQGTALNRAGRIHIYQNLETDQVWVGGDTQTCTQGTLTI